MRHGSSLQHDWMQHVLATVLRAGTYSNEAVIRFGRDLAFWIVRLRINLRLQQCVQNPDAFDATRVLPVPTL